MSSRPEPEWDDVEVGWLLSLQQWREQDLCPCGCGWPAVVSQDPMTEFKVSVPPPIRCHVRTALSQAQQARAEEGKTDGLLWRAEVRD